MTKSEKIGYVFEYLCLAILAEWGVRASAHESIDASSIVSDLTIRKDGATRVLFLTHTRTQGMTNRKFYRTFEELAQRRTRTPSAICVNLALFEGGVRSPSQYEQLYSSLFDASAHVFPNSSQGDFVDFAISLSDPVTANSVASKIAEFPRRLKRALESSLAKAISCKRRKPATIDSYWQSEKHVSPGRVAFDVTEQSSIKLGLKLLALADGTILDGLDLSNETAIFKGKVSKADLEILEKRAVIASSRLKIGGAILDLSTHVSVAYRQLAALGVELRPKWALPYLLSGGAKILYEQLMQPELAKDVLVQSIEEVSAVTSAKELLALWKKDLASTTPRADRIDVSLRMAGLSQNDLSTRIQESLGVCIAQRNPMWFVIAKDGYVEVIGDIDTFLDRAVTITWAAMTGKKRSIEFWDFYQERRKTFLSHRSVRPEHLLLDAATSAFPVIKKKSRSSVLPRISGLPLRFSMSVQSSLRCCIGKNRELFVIAISTPDPQHHKHKEFAGKLRAIRYLWNAKAKVIVEDNTIYLAVVDGAWSEKQVNMLASAGWNVCGWNNLSGFMESICA
jgi:hypothetical protein